MKILSFISFFLYFGIALGGYSLKINDNIEVKASLDQTKENVIFDIIMPQNYYTAIGFGTSMSGAPIMVADATGENLTETPKIYDTYSEGYDIPKENMENWYKLLKADLQEKKWHLSIQRPLYIVREGRDETIKLGKKIDMIYAFKEGEYDYHGNNQRGFFYFVANPKTGAINFNQFESDSDTYYRAHGIMMYISWSILTFLSIVTGRYMKHFYNCRLIIHATSGLFITTNTGILVILALTTYNTGSIPQLAHRQIGIAVTALTLVQSIGGIFSNLILTSETISDIWSHRTRAFHRVLGYLLIMVSNYQVVTGLINYESSVLNLIYIHFAIYLMILFLLEMCYRWNSQSKNKGVLRKKNLREFTHSEVTRMVNNGKQLVLFNDYVLNISPFIEEHPGSTYVLIENLGKDIGKYFYGAYSMSPGVDPHTHSRYAADLMEEFVMGKLKITEVSNKQGNTLNYTVKDALKFSSEEKEENKGMGDLKPVAVKVNDNEFILMNRQEISKGVARVKLQNANCRVKKFYPGLSLSGKSWSLTSLQNHTSRYYTICNCMSTAIYDEYLTVINATLREEEYSRKYSSIEDYAEVTEDNIELIMKLYPESKDGITRQIFNSVPSDRYYIHGPVGNGLRLDRWNSKGSNLIFCGGTGILPFMDLFAFMARRILSEDAPSNALFPDEDFYHLSEKAKFVVYAYFTTREDAICLEILEAIENLYKKFKKGHIFKMNLIFTQEGGSKLEDDELVELLKDYKFANNGINKLFVCGPPRMNYQFQRLLPQIKGEEIGLAPGDIDIL
ncbi:unnamed protein product [Moneuplotes crassus]|uniref:Cytochrome b5 heme-binding domain-containing protein n=1 Tax=Euplotes crassus TaxID=5936 RepID=A0AAD1Y863_EUPCR|nr:unnamed protein product [Moneuplotes crassus]